MQTEAQLTQTSPQTPRLIGLKEVMRLTGVKKTFIYELCKRGELMPIKLSPGKTVWLEKQVTAWIEDRAREVLAKMEARRAASD